MGLLKRGVAPCFVVSPSPQPKVSALVEQDCYIDHGRLSMPLVSLVLLVSSVLLLKGSPMSMVVVHWSVGYY